jgi:conjugative transposon TraM protein
MNKEIHSVQLARKRRFMLILPLIVTPFIVFICWILGIVGPAEVAAQHGDVTGLNLNLPAPVPAGDSSWDKLKFYEQADKDSARLRKLQKQDPYFNKRKTIDDLLKKPERTFDRQPFTGETMHEADEQEKRVYEKISAIHREIERPAPRPKPVIKRPQVQVDEGQVERLERMMHMMNNKEAQEDPEMRQIRELIENIKDIQHPERVSERMTKEEVKPKVFDVVLKRDAVLAVSVQGNRFYSMDDQRGEVAVQAITAVVHEEQSVASGDLIKLRLSQKVFVNNAELQENNFVYGIAKINGNRMLVHVSFMQTGAQHFPVALDVIGHDGMPGIPVQGSKAAMAAAQTADRSAQGVNILSVDHSLGAQLAGAAIQSGKQLLKKQTKVVRYTIPAGYAVQLVNGVN